MVVQREGNSVPSYCLKSVERWRDAAIRRDPQDLVEFSLVEAEAMEVAEQHIGLDLIVQVVEIVPDDSRIERRPVQLPAYGLAEAKRLVDRLITCFPLTFQRPILFGTRPHTDWIQGLDKSSSS